MGGKATVTAAGNFPSEAVQGRVSPCGRSLKPGGGWARIAELFGTVTSEKDLLGKVHLSLKHCIRKEGGGCATANSVGPAVDVPQSLGAWSNIFQAYRASAVTAVKWRAVGLHWAVGLHGGPSDYIGHPTDQQKHMHWMPTMCPHTGSFRCSKQGGLLATSWYAAHRLRRQAPTNKSAMEHRHSRDCVDRWQSLSSGRAFGLSDGCTRPAPEATSSRVLMCRVTTPMFATSNVRPLCSCMSSRTAGTTGTLSMKSINDSI